MLEKAHALLRVDRNADIDQVRQAYLRLVRRYPPEHFPDKFARIKQAYEQLILDPKFLKGISSEATNCETLESFFRFFFQEALENNLESVQDWFRPEDTAKSLLPIFESEQRKEQLVKALESIKEEEVSFKT